ncbi:hypothetical protein [Sphingomonas oligophenolica]|uniref:Uncharacterized protein n=1 Tax=Sphingomonas oligophenolica TaxID=301154 RepID=A0A502CLM0_9SPHN|nr:hypothetical protein [Sphingomonas oligophenolica]TPG13652.1 hypothetical protein EAH84_05600 [Sphingomonas oligophenolica]
MFRILDLLQAGWYRNDWLRERFVSMCRDPDVQRLTWEAYMNKELVTAQPEAHLRLFFANVGNVVTARFGKRPSPPANDQSVAGSGAAIARSIA